MKLLELFTSKATITVDTDEADYFEVSTTINGRHVHFSADAEDGKGWDINFGASRDDAEGKSLFAMTNDGKASQVLAFVKKAMEMLVAKHKIERMSFIGKGSRGPVYAKMLARYLPKGYRVDTLAAGDLQCFEIVKEDIFRSPNNPKMLSIAIDTKTKHRSSDRESIATVQPLPLRSTASKTRGVPVYYAYSYLHSDEVTEILKAIKGKSDVQVEPRQYAHFFTDTVAYLVKGLKQKSVNPDIVVCPVSSSGLVRDFAQKLAASFGIKVVSDAFLKQKAFKLPEDKVEALKLITDKFVDHELIAAKYHGDDVEKFTARVALNAYQSIKKYGNLELKGVDKQTARFIKGFMDKKPDVEYDIMDKSVLLVDDVLSSGSTMSEMSRLVKDECLAKEVNGVVIFNMTTSKS